MKFKTADYKTIDYKFHDLCEEIDYWKAEAKHYKKQYEIELQRNAQELNKQFEESKKGVANALMFALSVKDNADGSLSISKADREQLKKNYRPNETF